jgi:hypothetical protein
MIDFEWIAEAVAEYRADLERSCTPPSAIKGEVAAYRESLIVDRIATLAGAELQ